MTSEEKLKKQLEESKNSEKENKKQPDPFGTNKTLYNPTTGDLYITITDKNGNVRRNVINLLND